MFKAQVPFNFLIKNHNDWDKPLPNRLATKPVFVMSIKDQAYVDSFIDDKNKIVLSVYFDDNLYTKVLEPEDIQGFVSDDNQTPILIKPFEELPKPKDVKTKKIKTSDLNEDDVNRSMSILLKNNPHFIKK
jgi:hypothetical protein